MPLGPMELLVILAIVLLLFGTKKLRNIGEDLGAAVKGFKKGVKDGADEKPAQIAAGSSAEDPASEKKD